MRYANIKKASQDEQQNQTIITSKTLSVLKAKLNNKVNIASDKTEIKQNNLQFTRKDIGRVHNRAWSQIDNKEQKQ